MYLLTYLLTNITIRDVITIFLGGFLLVVRHCQGHRRSATVTVNREFVTSTIEINNDMTMRQTDIMCNNSMVNVINV